MLRPATFKRQKAIEANNTKKENPSKSSSYDPKIIHVSNLPETSTKDKLLHLFSEYGEVVDVRLIHKGTSGVFKGFAYVEFTDDISAAKTVAAGTVDNLEKGGSSGGIKFEGKVLKISPAKALAPGTVIKEETIRPKPKKSYSDQLTLYATNLPYFAKEDDIRNCFAQADPSVDIKEIRLSKNRDTGKNRGWAYIEFEDEESLKRALEKTEGKKIHNFPIKLGISDPQKSRIK